MTYFPAANPGTLPAAGPLTATDTIMVSQGGAAAVNVTLGTLAIAVVGSTLTGVVPVVPVTPIPTGATIESTSGTLIAAAGGQVTDANLVSYTLVSTVLSALKGLQIAVGALVDNSTGNAVSLLYYAHRVYWASKAGYWYGRTGSTWTYQPAGDPRGIVVAPPAETLTVVTPTSKIVGAVVTVTGTYANAVVTALDYSLNNGGTWVAATSPVTGGGNYSFSLIVAAVAAAQTVMVRDHANPSIIATSGPFAVTATAPPETLTVVTPAGQVATVAFTVTGTYANAVVTALDYSLNGGSAWVAAATPTIGGGNYSFSVTVAAASASQTIMVRDHANTAIIATSGAFVVGAAQPAPTFLDAFTGTSVNTANWSYEYGYSSAAQGSIDGSAFRVDPTYAATNSVHPFSQTSGLLTISTNPTPTALLATVNNAPFTSGLLTSQGKFSQTYGYFEVVAKVSAGSGMTCQFWLMPNSGVWPPELDIMEVIGNQPTGIAMNVVEGTGAAPVAHSQNFFGADLSLGFHAYAVDWQTDFITWFLDGVQIAQLPTPAALSVPMHMIVSMSVGTATSFQGYPAAGTVFPQTYQIRSVTVRRNRPTSIVTPAFVESAEGASVTTVGPSITDGAGNVYTITSGGFVGTNGVAEATITAGVVQIYYHNHQLYQKNNLNDWYTRTSVRTTYTGPVGSPVPANPSTGLGGGASTTESPQGTQITSSTSKIVDAGGNVFTLASAQSPQTGLGVYYNGVYQSPTSGVALGLYYNHIFYQQAAGVFYQWNGTTYLDSK